MIAAGYQSRPSLERQDLPRPTHSHPSGFLGVILDKFQGHDCLFKSYVDEHLERDLAITISPSPTLEGNKKSEIGLKLENRITFQQPDFTESFCCKSSSEL